MIVGILSVGIYMGLVTYYCIKQKCYTQLVQNYVVLIGWAIVYIVQHYYLDKIVEKIVE